LPASQASLLLPEMTFLLVTLVHGKRHPPSWGMWVLGAEDNRKEKRPENKISQALFSLHFKVIITNH
jgi:hypothetical protein